MSPLTLVYWYNCRWGAWGLDLLVLWLTIIIKQLKRRSPGLRWPFWAAGAVFSCGKGPTWSDIPIKHLNHTFSNTTIPVLFSWQLWPWIGICMSWYSLMICEKMRYSAEDLNVHVWIQYKYVRTFSFLSLHWSIHLTIYFIDLHFNSYNFPNSSHHLSSLKSIQDALLWS